MISNRHLLGELVFKFVSWYNHSQLSSYWNVYVAEKKNEAEYARLDNCRYKALKIRMLK